MAYTVNELTVMKSSLAGTETIQEFVEKLHINDYKFIELLNDLLESKIYKETKLRKKRVIKLVNKYQRTDHTLDNTTGLKEYLKSENIANTIKTLFSTKKETISDEVAAFYIKDFNEYFSMFTPSTSLNDILQTCK